MLYRAIVSGHPAFADLRVNKEQKESIRKILNNEVPFIDISTYTLVSESDTHYQENLIYANSMFENAPLMWANEFIFFIDFGNSENVFAKFERFKMQDGIKTKVGVLTNQQWNEFRQAFLQKRVEKFVKDKKSQTLSNILGSLIQNLK